jgi:diaminopimelate decarboxylase
MTTEFELNKESRGLDAQTRPYIKWPNMPANVSVQQLEVDGVNLPRLREAAEGPAFVTSMNAVRQRAETYVKELALQFSKSRVFYAMKANSAPAILREVAKAGCGIDIVSVGEFRAARAAGVKASDICFAGVGKTEREIVEAVNAGLGVINVEHAQELSFVLGFLKERRSAHLAAKENEKKGFLSGIAQYSEPLVALRLNPCVESPTHPHLKTGALDSKFGMLTAQVMDWLKSTRLSFTREGKLDEKSFTEFISPLRGIHVHIGSQLQSHDVFPLVLERVRDCALGLADGGIRIDHLDLGGGLGVGPQGVPADASDITAHVGFQARALKSLVASDTRLQNLWDLDCGRLHVCIEPGRSLVASSTVFLTEVLFEKANLDTVRFAYVDAGMNAFPRPSIYGAEHSTACANKANTNLIPYKVFGPVCESGDVLAREAHLPLLYGGDIVVFFEAGAYCRSMASHYNLRTIPAEIFVRDGSIESVIPAIDPTAHLDPRFAPAEAFSGIVDARRSVRIFDSAQSVPATVIHKAIDHALLAPNSSNLQMWEFYWVRNEEKKKRLVKACLSQPAARTAAELLVCVARTDTWGANRQRMIDLLQRNDKAPDPVLKYYKKLIPLAMNQGPLGIYGLIKTIGVWCAGLFKPVPRQPTSKADMRVWAVKSTALACENLMLSLRSQGFDSCAMEGFDSVRVKKILGLPRRGSEIVMVIGTGAGKPEGFYGPRIRFDRQFYAFEV